MENLPAEEPDVSLRSWLRPKAELKSDAQLQINANRTEKMTPLCFAAGPDRWTDPTETSSYRSFEKDGWKAFGNFLSPGISIETFQTAQHPVFRLEAWVQCSPYSPQQKLFIWQKHPQVFCSLCGTCVLETPPGGADRLPAGSLHT